MPVICSPVFPESSEPEYAHHFAEFGFPLSDFQKHAIAAIVDGHHVLVCAPTGSGKTLPAEFAIRHFIRQGRRVIYTTPIKALSNQKYHEFSEKFAPLGITVGLCTGDIKTNPTADLLIMTAEILNNRLFSIQSQQSSANLSFEMNIETELAAVIMDEVHYINDESRGHVWEQTILTLPPQIQMIMLSATLDGPERFADWIQSARPPEQSARPASYIDVPRKQVYLAQTHTRIVPLTHYVYFPPAPQSITKAVKSTPLEPIVKQQTNNLITLQSAHNVFQPAGYKIANQLCEVWQETLKSHVPRKHLINSLATFMRGSDDMDVDDTMLPAIVFTLSRKQVEESAHELTANILAFDSKIPYTAAHECENILRRLPNWREYAELPEYKALIRLLEKGVGIHHSGMIPVLREIVEHRISEKKIFMLFATESFAIGLDCPIRTAVFTGVTKFDGSEDRFFYPHEYTQMAGRAGRRGIDKVGNVVHLPLLFRKGMPSELAFRDILSNKPQILVSKFHIDYKMVLSLLKKGINADFHLFAERSMSKTNLEKETDQQSRYLAQINQELSMLRTGMQHIRTPLDICKEYEGLLESVGKFANKKRKDIERRMAAIKDQHRYILDDMRLFAKVNSLETIVSETEAEIRTTASYLRTQTEQVCAILLSFGAINKKTEEDSYELSTPLGIIAAQFAEVHPVPLALLILKSNWFANNAGHEVVNSVATELDDSQEKLTKEVSTRMVGVRGFAGEIYLAQRRESRKSNSGWTAKQLVGLLSVFVDIRLPEHLRVPDPQCSDAKVKDAIVALDGFYDEIRHEELERGCYTGVVYEGALCFDMTDTMMEWCDMTEESECKTWLQDLVASNVSAGDFAKACMKLSAIAKEMCAMCEVLALVPTVGSRALELAHKLCEIDALILKHIATTQSLYL